jgi:hypothetical protein
MLGEENGGREMPQLIVNERQQLLARVRVGSFDRLYDASHVRQNVGHTGTPGALTKVAVVAGNSGRPRGAAPSGPDGVVFLSFSSSSNWLR